MIQFLSTDVVEVIMGDSTPPSRDPNRFALVTTIMALFRRYGRRSVAEATVEALHKSAERECCRCGERPATVKFLPSIPEDDRYICTACDVTMSAGGDEE